MIIILKGNNENFLSIRLYDILEQIANINEYHWKLIWLEGISQQMNILELKELIKDSEDGFPIESKELITMSVLFDDLIELVLIGDKKESNLHKLDDDKMKANCEIFIELVDSSYWEISSHDDSFSEKIKANLFFY